MSLLIRRAGLRRAANAMSDHSTAAIVTLLLHDPLLMFRLHPPATVTRPKYPHSFHLRQNNARSTALLHRLLLLILYDQRTLTITAAL